MRLDFTVKKRNEKMSNLCIESNVSIKTSDVNFNEYEKLAQEAVNDVASRKGKAGQFLNWIGVLPENQLKQLDHLYAMAEKASENGKYTDLAILGIGGSRHTTECMSKLLGVDNRLHFFSSVDNESFKRFANNLNLDKTKFLVVSKSGGTLETTVGYQKSRELLEKHFGTKDLADKFVAMTDASSEKSKLRQIVDKGEIKLSGFVHDDVGGRFSILDDATIFALAYVGVSKADTKKMLEASLKAQENYLKTDINENIALKLAIFNVIAKEKGKQKHFVEYFGDAFQGATLWEKQLKNESLKANISTDTNVGPAYLHYNAEADLDDNNKDSFFTFVYVNPDDKLMKAVLDGVISAYSSQHLVSQIVLKNLDTDTVAQFLELKHFETLYTGNIFRRKHGNVTTNDVAMPEVLQPNVEKYKKEVKKALAD
jgi:glucose-6-phosphate isomerase